MCHFRAAALLSSRAPSQSIMDTESEQKPNLYCLGLLVVIAFTGLY